MDLRTSTPRSPNEEMLGLVSLARTIDKARAFNENTLGEYHYNCPHDQALFDFLGAEARSFAAKVAQLGDDESLKDWIHHAFLTAKTRAQIMKFNEERRAWAPLPGTESATYFDELKREVAPNSGVKTWFELLDLDEQRARIPAHA